MNLPMLHDNSPVTMSSREIADLCEKQHKHVLRDIEVMIEQIADPKTGGSDTGPKFGLSDFEGTYRDSTGRTLKEYRLPKDLTVTLITGYRADLRYKVVKRLEELEASKGSPAMLTGPQLLAAALIEANNTLHAQTQQIEAMREDVEAYDRIAKADGSLNITEAAKNLGVRPKDLFDWLARNGWIYKRAGGASWIGYQPKCNQGLLEHKTTTVSRADGSEKITEQVRITAKGLAALAKQLG